jgi:hypothetical protein
MHNYIKSILNHEKYNHITSTISIAVCWAYCNCMNQYDDVVVRLMA